MKVQKHVFKGGAARSEEKPRYDLIPAAGLRRIALRFTLGAAKFGDRNWEKGGADFIRDIPNHMAEHLFLYMSGDRSDDHLAAIGWGAVARIYFDEKTTKSTPSLILSRMKQFPCGV